jgi:hypothetical protein
LLQTAWLYRRFSFLWNYPASMNLFCLAALGDLVWSWLDRLQPPTVLPVFAGIFAATIAVKQVGNALRLLRGSLWEAP